MCILCGQLESVHDFAAEGVGPGPQYVGPLNNYTPPATLPTFTTDQIIQALRTSYITNVGTNVAPDPEDYNTWQNTQSWGTAGDIVYRINSGSAFEQSRIDLAYEIWDDAIAVNIRNDPTAGNMAFIPLIGMMPVGPTRFTAVNFASGTDDFNGDGTADAGSAYNWVSNRTQDATNNEYGTNAFTIDRTILVLGRNFGTEFDGLDGTGNPDNGVFDLTFFERRGFETILHEAGHGLGLSHPGFYNNGNVNVPAGTRFDQDSRRNTLMSYRTEDAGADSNADWNGLFAATPMVYDIAAIQRVYGADTQTRLGHTTYGFGDADRQDRPVYNFSTTTGSVFTIWDAGGTDTLNASQFTGNNVINLTPGSYSSIGQEDGNSGDAMIENVGIAFNAWIENAVGGQGNDSITGNDRNNVLDQGLGGGALSGGWGDDYLIAGPGAETINGGGNFDTLDYSRSTAGIHADALIGKVGGGWGSGDTFVEVERIIGTDFADRFRMGEGDETVEAYSGNDEIDGGGGNDTLYGYAGNDVLQGGAGGDFLGGGSDFDVATFSHAVTVNLQTGARAGEAVGDTYVSIEQFNGSPEGDIFVASTIQAARFAGGAADDQLWGGDQGDWLQGGQGRDYLNGGAGNDTASYADAPGAITVQMSFNDGTTDGKIIAGDWGLDTLIDVESVEGTAFDDYMIGDERNNTLSGLGGADRLFGDEDTGPHGSADTLLGGDGNDIVTMGANDSAIGGRDSDTVNFVGGPIYLDFGSTTFFVGNNTMYLREFETYVSNDPGVDTVWGASYGETISLGDGNDIYHGQGGDDFLVTGAGADVMDGGTGFDTVVFHRAMVADWQAGVLDADIASDSWSQWEAIQGSSGDDRIRTNSWGYSVTLRGGGGHDVLATGVTGVIADRLFGETGDDQLDGGAGDDFLDGGDGSDRMTGGAGYDTANFASNWSDYRVSLLSSGEVQVADQRSGSPQGTDLVHNVEALAFRDRTIAPVAQVEDVVWRHADGTVATAGRSFGVVANSWQTVGFGDYDGDGDGDMLWRGQDGGVVSWTMQDGRMAASRTVATAANGWEIVNSGDFDGDGDADVLWRHRDGAVVTWEMENGRYVQNHNIAYAATGWNIQGLGDFDGDGDSDVLWRHRDGAVVTWEMEDGRYVRNHNIASAGNSWNLEGTGDFDGDGDDDILWHRAEGQVVVWEMEDGRYLRNDNIATGAGSWEIAGVVDFNDNGTDDILWRHQSSGQVVTWEMQAGAYLRTNNLGVVGADWHIRGTGDFDLV